MGLSPPAWRRYDFASGVNGGTSLAQYVGGCCLGRRTRLGQVRLHFAAVLGLQRGVAEQPHTWVSVRILRA